MKQIRTFVLNDLDDIYPACCLHSISHHKCHQGHVNDFILKMPLLWSCVCRNTRVCTSQWKQCRWTNSSVVRRRCCFFLPWKGRLGGLMIWTQRHNQLPGTFLFPTAKQAIRERRDHVKPFALLNKIE